MKTVGIIAEYNPFHNGHLYQITRARELSGADFCVVVMSGNFTQRGIPAILDKYSRTRMALAAGADLVLELPVLFSTASAEYFAHGGVTLLDSLKVDSICFGCEDDSLCDLTALAHLLVDNQDELQTHIQTSLKQGMTYPQARIQALRDISFTENDLDCEKAASLLSSPNNILAIEYLKALYNRGSQMEVYALKRQGASYLSDSLENQTYASAMAIRTNLTTRCDFNTLAPYVPAETLDILRKSAAEKAFLTADDFSVPLFTKLLEKAGHGYCEYADITPALSDKIKKNLYAFTKTTAFAENILKSRDLTLTRILRSLTHILLDITQEDLEEARSMPYAGYARILGLKKTSEAVFSALDTTHTPLISKLADSSKYISGFTETMLSKDILASHLYEGVRMHKNGCPIQNEYSRPIITLFE